MQYKELNSDSNLNSTTTQNLLDGEGQSSFSYIELLERLMRNWYWLALGLIVALSAAYIHLRYAENYYRAEAKLLLKEDATKGRSELSALMERELGRMDTKPNISDQIEIMRSRRLVSKVVQNLDLNVRYFSEGRFKKGEFFQETTPVVVKVLSKDYAPIRFELKMKSANKFDIIHNEQTYTSSLGSPIKIGETELMVLPKDGKSVNTGRSIMVAILSIESATSMYKEKLTIVPVKDGSVLSVSMVDNLPDRAKIVIDELISQYNEDAINDKRLIGEKTTKFIEDRLAKVSDDLQSKDRDLEVFKKSNHVIDLQAEGGLSLNEKSANHSQVLAESTQLSLVDYMQDYLKTNGEDLIPVNVGLTDAAINANVSKYNELILAKKDMLKHSTESSEIVQNLNQQIAEIGSNLTTSLNNYKKTTQISLNKATGEGGRISSQILAFPTQEKEFKQIARQQQIVEALYLFLLQKREENEINNSATPSAIKVVDYAYSDNSPIAPKRQIIYLGAAVVGLMIPLAILYLSFLLNNKVQNRKDIEITGISIIGDIPNSKADEIIQENDRSILAEAFRILRTHINFYLPESQIGGKSIFITSTVSGEGKTFVASNLATILATSEKYKVLLVGADIRSPRLLEMLDKEYLGTNKGVTHFLSDTGLQIQDVITHDASFKFDIIHSGVIAPNPSELLMNGRFKELIDEAKNLYDFVIVDTAPVSLVTDTQIIANYADLFLYVIRANYLDKRLLEIPRDLYRDKRLPNMALILNDVGAGNGYGYGYGYGYGGYADEKPKNWKRFLPARFR